jgi:hypothetical protein
MNDVNELSLEECIARLRDRVRLLWEAGERLLNTPGGKLVSSDMLVAALVNRSMGLIRGFCSMITGNYICAAPLVRLQLENLLRFSALWLVDDRDDFTAKVISGAQINKLKDRDGKQMNDGYLAQRMNERIPGLAQVYKAACGYIHFSDAHLYHTLVSTGERSVRIEIGEDMGVTDADRKEGALVMDQMTRQLLSHMKLYPARTWSLGGSISEGTHAILQGDEGRGLHRQGRSRDLDLGLKCLRHPAAVPCVLARWQALHRPDPSTEQEVRGRSARRYHLLEKRRRIVDGALWHHHKGQHPRRHSHPRPA